MKSNCKHDYYFIRNFKNGMKRSIWKCDNCGKLKSEKGLSRGGGYIEN